VRIEAWRRAEKPLRSATETGRHVGLDKMCLLIEVHMQDLGCEAIELSERSDNLPRTGSASKHYVTPMDKYAGIWIQESFLVSTRPAVLAQL
jgi:hypothetical protein